MGRSKFPGKPSKSINRKRISVLQIDDETSAATATATTTSATATKEQEDETLTAPVTTTSAAAVKNNKHNRDDDDENDHGGNGQARSSGGGGGGDGTGSGNGSGVMGGDGNSCNSNNDSSTTTGKSVNGSSTNNSSGQKNGSTESAEQRDSTVVGKVDIENAEASNKNKPTTAVTNKNEAENEQKNENNDEGDDDEDDEDDEDEDQEDDETDEDDDGKLETKSFRSSPIKQKKCNKKFRNLNLLKPEVMLPSSSKLKQQQQQIKDLNRLSPIPLNNPFAIKNLTEVKNTDEKSHKKTEISSSSTSSETKPSDSVEEKTATTTTIITTTTMASPSLNSSTCNTISTESITTKTANSTPLSATSKPKKSVTFKNILETSDDKSAVKKFYNPNNRTPLVSIMKKECMNRPLMYSRSSECIVRPSRLTEILKNKNNIDKLDALKFRSSASSTTSSTLSSINIGGPFGIGGLSRAFGAPVDGDTDKQDNCVKFRMDGFEKNEGNVDQADGINETQVGETIGSGVEGVKTGSEIDATLDADGDDEQQMIVDKHFVLPKRTRSSRVVKPNKRLVEDGIICKKSSLVNKSRTLPSTSSTAASTAATTQQELLPLKQEQKTTNTTTPLQKNYFGLGDYNDSNSIVDGLKMLTAPKESTNINETKPNLSVLTTALNKSATATTIIGSGVPTATSTSSLVTFGGFSSLKTNSNFILRQPRLQFDSLSERGSNTLLKAPLVTPSSTTTTAVPTTSKAVFSSTIMTNANIMQVGTNCSVCDSSVQSKIIQQAHKYGEISCTICRKFISKITKKSIAASACPTLKILQLQCKADGNCCIQPSVKSHSKNFKKIYKERCSACWLKKCLLHLQFSTGHRQRLSAVLSSNVLKQSLSESKRLIISTTDTSSSISKDNEQLSTSGLKKEPGLLSPSALSSSRLPITTGSIQQQLKWKTTLEKATEGLRINLKSNPLAENNITFGSTPILRPAILEKPLFLKTLASSSSSTSVINNNVIEKQQVLDNLLGNENTGQLEILHDNNEKSTTKTKRKHKDKERLKEREKDLNHKATTTISKSNESIASNDIDSISVPIMVNSTLTTGTSTITSTNSSTSNATEITETETIMNNATMSITATTSTTPMANSSTTPTVAITNNSTDNLKRQRIDLKGPRVKHVCRSASIVLGQPIAMFGEDEELSQTKETEEVVDNDDDNEFAEDEIEAETAIGKLSSKQEPESNAVTAKSIEKDIVIDENDNCSSFSQQKIEPTMKQHTNIDKSLDKPVLKNLKASATIENKPEIIEVTCKSSRTTTVSAKSLKPLLPVKNTKGYNINTTTTSQISKKYMRHFNYNNNSENVQQLRRKDASALSSAIKTKALISIDFWENYDPAEVCQTGFGLIVTETVAQRALCFLCGSTGLDPLLFCACCCEPYHQYCVLDEYNLKHSSLDDTMASLLLDTSTADNTATVGGNTQLTQRLNWLCPRCTVCYTCNMSSGSKVKCQKCQKNYHSTCLGTSKRLLGADRPLICVNCLKCKSCSTTKVSKFVGNLPMCTSCFKLRKRGNYCPICQKCYDDNDFDLKMMECGDCKQWVHSKCEGLSDEQYNLLSTLPETIEFICKKCARRNENSKQRASEWRQTVMEEFKTGLLTVLKLLSKSRQACALLKLSPRKKVNCTCSNANGRMQPKALMFNAGEREQLGSDGESQCSEDIYEFNEGPTGNQLNLPSDKIKSSSAPTTKCTCGASDSHNSYYSTATPQGQQLTLIDIKKKIANNSYTSLAEFNYDMNNVIQLANCDELIISYKEILSEQFPWFQNETKACTDALEEDMFEAGSSYGMNAGSGSSLDGNSPADMEFGTSTIDMENNNQLIDLPENVEDIVFTYKTRQDGRICLFCRKTGEGPSNEESRLLYCGHDCWVHINCAMWSAEVFEEIDGSLQNVHSAVSRGRMIKCTVCGNRGASVGCNVKSCGEHYHYPCARSINCAFLTDKSMYCPTHASESLARAATPNVSIETNFEVTRPVYVELDRKRKKLIDPSRVQFHIGSLEVRQLGTVFPRFSDSFEAIVPINFLCSRLYWSCKEPWKIVEYTVRTTIQNSFSTLSTLDMGRNFTVDHSNPNSSLVQLGLAQISRWHNSLTRGENIDMEYVNAGEFANGRNPNSYSKFLPEYLLHSQNSVLMSNTDENTEEEPQTNADLLPPDLKDAIFEDLPHELLDGISMLDIFPKFMNYEELGNVGDCKTEAFLNDQSKDGVSIATTTATAATTSSNQLSDNDDTVNSSFSKQMELSNSWSSSSTTNSTSINHVEDAMLSAARNQFKRTLNADLNKGEGLFLKVGNATVSATAAALKRRKLAKSSAEDVLLSLSQRQRTKKEAFAAAALARRQTQQADSDMLGGQRTKTFTWSAAKRYMESVTGLEDSRDVHNIKLMQVDGVDDSVTEYRIISAEAHLNGTVKCDRCRCTYRTYDSFQRHLSTCEQLSTSESDSERAPSRSPPGSIGATITASHLLTADGLSNELNKIARNATMVNATATSTAASLPFIQAFQQATATGIPLGGIQTTPNIAGIPIANMQGQGVHALQNLQGLQNLQSLQSLQFQNLQPQAINGTNFFISQAPTTSTPANSNAVNGTDDLQFFSNALQSLTANLNGTYTLAPTGGGTGGFTVQPQTTAQSQLIAVSTNPDGTQQIIQLPTAAAATTVNPQLLQATTNGFQSLQTTASDKKIMIPIASKPLNSKAGTKAMPPPSNKQKLKANAVKPIQSKIAPNSIASAAATPANTIPQITLLNATGSNPLNNSAATTQMLNQNLLQQLQAAANSQQQPLLFQTGATTQQQPIIMQQPAQNLISFVTTDGSQNPQVQYVSIPTGDFKPQQTAASYITAAPSTGTGTNPLLQGATFLQTDASGNLMLTTTPTATANGHLQMLSATPLNQPAQVIGTLIQPQTLQLNGNVLTTAATNDSQQPVIIGGTTTGGGGSGLEMIAAANAAAAAPQVILATQPMYYGLETIVQNTVMSSQQFVSTAMPGVLSQNASFSATTTQVFQASKIEPLVDIPAGYVVLNNVDATPSLVQQQAAAASTSPQQQPQQQPTHSFLNATGLLHQANTTTSQDQQPANLETIYRIQQQQQTQSSGDNATTTTTYHFATAQPIQQQQTQPQIVTAKIPPVVTQIKQRNNNITTTKQNNSVSATKVQPQVVNKVLPTSVGQQQQPKFMQKQLTKSVLQQQQHQQQPTANILVRSSTITTLPATVSTTVDSLPTQQFIVTQARPATSISSTPLYDSNMSQYQTVNQQQQQQIYTTVQPMAATISLTTSQQQATTTATTKPLSQTANARKTNLIRPIHKAEVKPKILKGSQNISSTTPLTSLSNTKQQADMISPTATIKLKPQEPLTANVAQQIPTLQAINTTNMQPTQQYNLITVAQPKQGSELEQQSSQINGVSQNITLQQTQPPTTYVYDQQQKQIIEYQQTEQLQQQIDIDNYQQQETTQNHQYANNSNNTNHTTNNNSNRLQFSTSNSVYNSNVPTNIVNPIQFTATSTTSNMHTTTLTSRPTNRVLPMQQKQQQQDHGNKNLLNNHHHNNVNINSKRPQQQQNQQQQPTVKCYENLSPNFKSCYDAEHIKKDQQSSSMNGYVQRQQHEAHLQQHETFQVLHVQQQDENGEIGPTIEFSVSELKNGDLQLLENQQHTSGQLDVVSNNLQHYDHGISATSDCLLDEKQHQKMLNTAFTIDQEPESLCEEANESVSSNIAQEDNEELQGDEEEDDDGFSLKMPSDDEDGMDLDQAISESDEPAVKEKISKILDNLTNDDCADSIATATTVEANAAISMQRIQYMDTEICDNNGTSNNNFDSDKEASNANVVEVNNTFIGNEVEDVAAAYIAQIAETAESIVGDTMKSFKKDLTPQIVAEIDANNKLSSMDTKENTLTSKETTQVGATAITTPQTNHAQHPPYYPNRDPKKISGPHLLYEIQSEDGFTYKSTSITEVWEKVFEAVQVARRAHGLALLPEGPLADMSGVQMIGLKTNALKYLIEQLPGVEKCSKYTPKYHKRSSTAPSNMGNGSGSSSIGTIGSGTANCDAGITNNALDYGSDQEELQENPFECVRCEPYGQRSEYDMFSWLASRHRKQPIQVFVQPSDTEIVARRGTGSNLPMAMKYRTLKETYKDYVGVFRSHIHGRGLYCTKDIEAGEMVIEYAGELIRSTLTDKRERNYNSRGIGCYMFKIDDNLVVDATMRGNAARFINHSCEPNCYSKVVDILGHKHIIIFALRRIVQGEELTYDYKFPFEDEKIPCSCGSKKCRKYLN